MESVHFLLDPAPAQDLGSGSRSRLRLLYCIKAETIKSLNIELNLFKILFKTTIQSQGRSRSWNQIRSQSYYKSFQLRLLPKRPAPLHNTFSHEGIFSCGKGIAQKEYLLAERKGLKGIFSFCDGIAGNSLEGMLPFAREYALVGKE